MKLKCINIKPLSGNEVAPPLEEGKEYDLLSKIQDSKGNYHYDIGLKSEYTYVRSFETQENLPDGDKIHWCHPSRFEVIN